ncbi:MAG: ribosome biogenesis GTPase Der [Candidatus Limnocylindrales bacterium]
MSPRAARRASRSTLDRSTPLEGLPVVAVVGRPNVGKSTLFNRIVGERTAIVEDRARTTRDRLYGAAEWNGRRFIVVDTGGLERRPGDAIEQKVQAQARLAIAEADTILFVVDVEAGLTLGDVEAGDLLRAASVPVLLVVNKADNLRREQEAVEFHRLGWTETHIISAAHGRATGDMLDALIWALPPESASEIERKRRDAELEADLQAFGEGALGWPDATKADEGAAPEAAAAAWDAQVEADRQAAALPVHVAIVGRPNVGKSSLLNALLGEERTIVSDIPGTTRDAIDTALDWQGRQIRLIDTAGIRRRGKVAGGEAAERFSALRAMKAIGRADVAILILDAVDGLTAQDAHVAGYVVEEGKGLVLAVNKWDLVEKTERTFDEFAERIRAQVPFLDIAPVVSISALTGQRVGRVLEMAMDVAVERRRRIPTAELNQVIRAAAFRQTPPMVRNHRPKIFYATQVAVAPPTFVVFTSYAANVHFSYQRYLENQLRDAFGFAGAPIRLVFRERRREEIEKPSRRRGTKAGGGPSEAAAPARRAKTGRMARTARSRH